MDRFGVFVDAGYLLTSGPELVLGTPPPRRDAISCDFDKLVEALERFGTEESGLQILRSYWYDAGRDGQPDLAQCLVAELPSVKVRLGRLTQYGQKGVDSLIVRDLMTLGRERAIRTAYLITGDEDIREGVIAAQELGVRVVLLGVATTDPYTFNQAPSLVSEADKRVVLGKSFWAPFFAQRPTTATPLATLFFKDLESAYPGTFARGTSPSLPASVTIDTLAKQVGSVFASAWSATATQCEVRLLLERRYRVPRPLDAALLKQAGSALSRFRQQWAPDMVRRGFWDGLEAAFPQLAEETLPDST